LTNNDSGPFGFLTYMQDYAPLLVGSSLLVKVRFDL
jgi:hypothetical protein